MYFGYAQMWQFTFVPAGVVITLAASVAILLVFAVGAARGADAALRYLRAVSIATAVAIAADIGYAFAAHQMKAFVGVFGVVPLMELSVAGTMCVLAMWVMGASYIRTKMFTESRPSDGRSVEE